MSIIEEKMMEKAIKWLSRIGRELARANRLEAFRLRQEYASAENTPIIDKIMED